MAFNIKPFIPFVAGVMCFILCFGIFAKFQGCSGGEEQHGMGVGSGGAARVSQYASEGTNPQESVATSASASAKPATLKNPGVQQNVAENEAGIAHQCSKMMLESGHKISYSACVMCAGMGPGLQNGRTPETALVDMAEARDEKSDVSKSFSSVYKNKLWGDEGGGSGGGSDPQKAKLAPYIMKHVMLKYGLVSLLDAPCGGVFDSWTRFLITAHRADVPCFRYHGVDVVSSVIDKSTAAFVEFNNAASSPWALFSVVDLSSPAAVLPKGYD